MGFFVQDRAAEAVMQRAGVSVVCTRDSREDTVSSNPQCLKKG